MLLMRKRRHDDAVEKITQSSRMNNKDESPNQTVGKYELRGKNIIHFTF